VVTIMAKYQLGRQLAPKDLGRIVGFLKTLTGTRLEASR
jgi:cytochrome c peroxidase